MHLAAGYNKTSIVKLLLRYGANINPVTCDNITPVYLATLNKHSMLVRFLICVGADPHITNRDNSSILQIAVYFGDVELLELLRYVGCDIYHKDFNGLNAMTFAAGSGQVSSVAWLLDNGVPVNAPVASGGATALHAAAINLCNIDTMRLLIEHGIDINARDHKGNTALHYVAEKGSIEAVKLLLECDANPNVKNYLGKTASEQAITKGLNNIAYIIEVGKDVTDTGGSMNEQKPSSAGKSKVAPLLQLGDTIH
jgi:ankyrin repeat protein